MANTGVFTDYLEGKVLEHVAGVTAYTKPTTTYAALFTVKPTDAGGGTEVSTSGGTLYVRQPITWAAAVAPSITNSATIRFPSVGGAGASWGLVVAIGVFDSLTSGNLLWYGDLSASVSVGAGDDFSIAPSGLTLTLD